jgi:hypothetical protein
MTILIHFDRSDAMAKEFDLPAGRTTLVYDDHDGNWAQLTYDTLRTQDGRELASVEGGVWHYEGETFSDVTIDFTTHVPPKPHPEACVLFIEGGGDYCTSCGWHEEGHGDMPCCADWCGLHVDHDGPCKER